MKFLSRIRSWVRSVVHRSTLERELDDELRFHVDQYVEDLIRAGVSAPEARRRARVEFGGIDARKEECREAVGLRLLDEVTGDLRYAFRQLRRRPGVFGLVVVTLAIGVSAATTVFTLADAILWHPVPFRDANRLVRIRANFSGDRKSPSASTLDAWPARDQILDGVYPFALDSAIVDVNGEPQAVTIGFLAPGVLTALGVNPIVGREFTAGEHEPGNTVVIVSTELWRRAQPMESPADGRTMIIDGARATVVGVMPSGFEFPVSRVSLWRPLVRGPATSRVTALGKLKPAITVEQAQAFARATSLSNAERFSADVSIAPFVSVNPTTATALRVLLCAATLLLLIAVANTTNVLLADSVSRDAEMAIRASLGASRLTLARQLITETLLTSAMVAIVAVVASMWVVDALVKAIPYLISFQALRPIAFDWRAVLFATTVSASAGLATAWLSVVRVGRIDAQLAIRGKGAGIIGHARTSGFLTIGQIAVTLILLACAGLLGNGFVRLSRVDPGFNPDHVVHLVVQLPTWRYPAESQMRVALEQVRDEMARVPGVSAMSISNAMPPNLEFRPLLQFETGEPGAMPGPVSVAFGRVDEAFFSTLGIPVIAGRDFKSFDGPNGAPVAVVSRGLAQRFWRDGDAVGRRFRESAKAPWLTVVGVVGNVRNGDFEQRDSQLAYYTPRAQAAPRSYEGFVVRTRPTPEHVVPELRSILRRVMPDAPILDATTAYEVIASEDSRLRFATFLMTAFAGVALALALIGVYGAFWYMVRQRTREMGVRMALGAAPSDILRMVLARSVTHILIGLAVGLPLALGGAQAIKSVLFEVSPNDPATFAVVAVFLALAAFSATYLPARRAASVDPAEALRQD